MAATKETCVVEIPVQEEQEQEQSKIITAIQHHPLTEISGSPGHLLLLKLWQREDDLFARRIAIRETRMHSIKREISHLCCSFLLFHGLFLILLFASSTGAAARHRNHARWWVPSLLSLATSLVIVSMVQMKLCRYWKVRKQLQRERSENRALGRCVHELRMKGARFDLSTEPLRSTKRMKSLSVEINWRPLAWSRQYVVTACLVCFTGLVVPASKLILSVY